MCIVCESTLSENRRHDLSRHYKKHQVEVEEKQKLMPGSELRKEYVVKKKEDMKKRRNLFVKRSCESLAMLEASYEIAFVLAKKHMPFSDGEYIVKPCLQKFAKCLGDKSIERKVNEIALSKQTITRRIEELSHDVFEQLKERVHACSFFSLALDESADICDVAQLSIFIRGIDDNFNIFEELIGLESLHGKTRGSDIFEKVKSCLENQHLNFSKLLSVCTDGAPSMIGRVAGTVALLEKFFGRPLLKYHCIIHQESLCVTILNLQHVMIPVVKCVNKIRAKGLNRREFREYCEVLDMEYGDLILHCEVHWLSRGQVLKRFWKLKNIVHGFLEEKEELPEERILLCNEKWMFDSTFLVDITSHLNGGCLIDITSHLNDV
ncbi:general transcription factor II-I repeat domain-containing protein 2A-like isoform X1 [Tachypleus tridentatus]|uniref:general transcription factor II-I repeat domain-containing protein 2A-like isoform X1 n=1 Tax=Tachypleus tridentatus TaxID=6853 RepID=UPI003FCF1284